MQQDGSAGRHSRLLRNKPARSDGGSVANCRNLRDPQSALLQPMRGRPLNGHGKLQGDFPLHFPLSVTCESAGSCRQPPPVAAVRAISPGDFRSLARKKWEVRKNIPHRIWLRVGPQGYRDGLIKRLLILAGNCIADSGNIRQSGSVEMATDVKPLGVGVDPELNRGVEFSRIGFCDCIHRLSGWGFHPRLTTPCHLAMQ